MANTDEKLMAAVQAVLDGEKKPVTRARTGISVSALKKWGVTARAREPVERRRNFVKNIKSGFEHCGIYPLSLVRMQIKQANFQRSGTLVQVHRAKWLRVKHVVQQDVLVLPAPVRKRKQRKTVTVAQRLLTQ
ncbi:hypothetical protein PF004_g20371 [Phytophthora fragariae]|uniref:Uncharacterized protein n=2 Tax=Phytophthora fragariae TaxID=53985 RepID=A0A6G0N7B6_9STRA|nr:hypothetical protein PF004_g20371 [Phytophthora fragariae]